MKCPKCGSPHVDRDEVDIGVGTQVGPWVCFDCGWIEGGDVPIDRGGATMIQETPDDELDIYVPASWECPTCGFGLVQASIDARTGDIGITAADIAAQPTCPNDGAVLARVRWRDRAMVAEAAHSRDMERLMKATGTDNWPAAFAAVESQGAQETIPPTPDDDALHTGDHPMLDAWTDIVAGVSEVLPDTESLDELKENLEPLAKAIALLDPFIVAAVKSELSRALPPEGLETLTANLVDAVKRLIAPCPYCCCPCCMCDHTWGDSCRCLARESESDELRSVRAAVEALSLRPSPSDREEK